MSQSSFDEALLRLWPTGDRVVTGLRAGMIAAAPAVFEKYRIDTPDLIAHVMGQISHECGAGTQVIENLNYSAVRMTQVWPSRFPTQASARPYAGNPKALAKKVYNGRMGNGVGTDDGWTFRGRGAVQTTGRDGYRQLAAMTGLDLLAQPDLVNDPRHFLACGVADFIICGCLAFAAADDVVGVTRRLNGGTIGLVARQQWVARWKAALGPAPVVQSPGPVPTPVKPARTPTAPPKPDAIPAQERASFRSALAQVIAAIVAVFRRT